MMIGHEESIWKLSLGILISFVLFCIGIGHVFYPDYFLRRSAVRNGGEMLTDVNQLGFQFVGVVMSLFAGFMFYCLVTAIFGT
jgi:hypothetical protein